MATKRWLGNTPSHVGEYGHSANWDPSGVPTTGDDVVIPVGSEDITENLDQSAVALASFVCEVGAEVAMGTADEYLQIDADLIVLRSTSTVYLDVGSSNGKIEIYATASATTGTAGVYLIGADCGTVSVNGGTVAIAIVAGQTATVDVLRVKTSSAVVTCGEGTTLTAAHLDSGSLTLNCAAGTVNANGGTLTTFLDGTITTLTVNAGTVVCNSTGTITSLYINGGSIDFLQNGSARTITNCYLRPASDGAVLKYHASYVTITNWNHPTDPITLTAERP